MNRWYEGTFWQQRDNGGDYSTMGENKKEWRSLAHMLTIEFYAAIFAWFLSSFGPPSRALVASPGEGWDAVGVICEKGATTDIKVQVTSVWAM